MELEITKDGFLINKEDWTKEIAEKIATEEGIILTEQHWEIIFFIQEYYAEYSLTPIMRILGKAISKKLDENKGKSRYLYSLFPEVPIKQAARIAGLPKPPSCI